MVRSTRRRLFVQEGLWLADVGVLETPASHRKDSAVTLPQQKHVILEEGFQLGRLEVFDYQ